LKRRQGAAGRLLRLPVVTSEHHPSALPNNAQHKHIRARLHHCRPPRTTTMDKSQVTRACQALLEHMRAHAARNVKNVLPMGDEDQDVVVTLGLSQFPEAALKTFKGHALTLPHTFRDQVRDVCLLVKDKEEAKKWVGDDKKVVQKVIALQQLRTQYKTFESKRELAARFDAFLADDRIVCMLPKTLGKAFYAGPKRPLPLRLARRDKPVSELPQRIRQVLDSAFFYLSGTCCAIKIGSTKLSAAELADNVLAAVTQAVEFVPGKWAGLQSVHVKGAKSAALPVYERAVFAAHVVPPAPALEGDVVAPVQEQKLAKAGAGKRPLAKAEESPAKKQVVEPLAGAVGVETAMAKPAAKSAAVARQAVAKPAAAAKPTPAAKPAASGEAKSGDKRSLKVGKEAPNKQQPASVEKAKKAKRV
jgi:hypothetical protein